MIHRHLFRFGRNEDGNVAILFAMVSIPILGFTGAAIDYGFATRQMTQLQAATDATALLLCQTASNTTNAALQTKAQDSMASYMGDKVNLTVDPVVVASSPRKISLTTHARSRSYFSAFTGQANLDIAAKAQCSPPEPKTFEIALVLDTTGSMAKSSGSQSKMDAAKEAARKFVDYVKSNAAFTSDTRISIVPFSASVAVDPATYRTATWVDRLGQSSYHWTNIDKTQATAAGFTSRLDIFDSLNKRYPSYDWGWAGCFETLPYPENVQDTAPSAGGSLYVPLFAPDEPGNGADQAVEYADNAGTKFYSFNSYLNDATDEPGCKSSMTTFQNAEKRACKYNKPKGVVQTSAIRSFSAPAPANGPNFGCTSLPLQTLTTDATVLKALVDRLTPAGATNLHEGLMWGWRTLSPNSVFASGSAYNPTKVNKVIILMTDGANSWTNNPYNNYNETMFFSMGYFKNADGSNTDARMPPAYANLSSTTTARNALDELTRQACTNAKKIGTEVSIYTIGFSVPVDPIDQQGIDLLANCASAPGQAFVANDSSQLIAAFDQIAKSIGALRLTQ